jgi:hypothetical protein
MSSLVPPCNGRYRVFSPPPATLRCGTPRRAWPEISHLESAELFAPQRVIEQRRKNGPVALLLDSFLTVRGKQLAGLVIPNCRRLAFAAP